MSGDLSIGEQIAARARERAEALKDNGVFEGDIFPGVSSLKGGVADGRPPLENVRNQNPAAAELASSGEVLLALTSIEPPTISQRQAYPREMVDRMATSIRRMAVGKDSILDGQIHPIVVVPKPGKPGHYCIVDGFTRFQAFQTNYLSDVIKATIRTDLSEAEVFAMAYSANVDRNGTTDFDRGMALAEALAAGIYQDQQAIATSLGIEKPMVTGLLAFSKLPENVVVLIKETPEKFTYNIAARLQAFINKEPPEEQVIATVKKISDGSMPFKKLTQMVSDFSTDTGKSKKKARRDTRNILGYGKVRATDTALSLDLDSLPENLAPQLIDVVEQAVTNFLKQHIPSEAFNQNAGSDGKPDAL